MTAERFRTHEVAALLGGGAEGPDRPFPFSVCYDSREVTPGCVFAALPGERTDGHRFVGDAVAGGASAVLALRGPGREARASLPGPADVAWVFVDSVEDALVTLARQWRERVAPKVYGITGSVGKTTTRDLILRVLASVEPSHGAPKSYNTRIGCASTVLGMPPDTRNLVLEYGTNHPGEISTLVDSFPPQELFLTEVCPAHLEGLGDVQGVLAAKLELLESRQAERVTYNFDNALLRDALQASFPPERSLGVGVSGGEVRIERAEPRWTSKGPVLDLHLREAGRSWSFASRLWGRQHAYAWAFAWSVALRRGVGEEALREVAETSLPLPGRGRVLSDREGLWILDETYNANPASMGVALANLHLLSSQGAGASWAILGGMRELGEASPHWHREILGKLRGVDGAVLVGEEWAPLRSDLPDQVRWVPDTAVLLEEGGPVLPKQALLLLKGSRSYGLERLLPLFRGDAA